MGGAIRRRRQQTPEQIARVRRTHVAWLAMVVFLVFAASLGGGFVWTDREDLLQGAHRLTDLEDVRDALLSTRADYRARVLGGQADSGSGSWQPLTLLSNSVSWALWGDCAFCFHLENLLLHLLTVVGLYALGRHLLSQRRHGPRLAGWAAALYALHPATVSTVAWIGGRPYLLATALMIWGLVAFSRLQATSNSHHRQLRRWLAATTILATLAMLAHETAYLMPVLALLIAAAASRERNRPAFSGIAWPRLLALGLIVVVLLSILGYRSLVMGGIQFSGTYPSSNLFDNIGTALRHFWYLLEQTVLPAEPAISDVWPVTQGWGVKESAALLGLLALIAGTAFALTIGHPAAVGVAWFLICIVPGVGVFPSDHYHNSHTLYLATWGLAFAFVQGIYRLWRPVGRQLMPGSEGLVLVPMLLVLGLISTFSSVRWWDHKRLFESEVATDPYYMEGRLELAKAALEERNPGGALNHLMAAFEAAQDKAFTGYWSPLQAYVLLGRAYHELGQHSEAAASLGSALEIEPEHPEAVYRLGLAQLALGNLEQAEQVLRAAATASRPNPDAAAALGVVLALRGQFAEAEPLLQQALQGGTGEQHRVHGAMALVLVAQERLADAAAALQAALAVKEDAEQRARLAWVLWQLGQHARAREEFNVALQTDESGNAYIDWVGTQIRLDGTVPVTPAE